ncbi:MAG: hypothetical protein Q7U75_16550 [Desulfobacterales bacterium]|nr:hypothetical protein [Desulfobacterales bacterium]
MLAAAALFLLAGCTGNTKFVYKPSAPTPGVPKLPVKIAVLSFQDGTGNYKMHGQRVFVSNNCTFNLAKAGNPERIDPLTPELWSKAFADEMAVSVRFEAVRFLYDRSELTDEDIFVVNRAMQGMRRTPR